MVLSKRTFQLDTQKRSEASLSNIIIFLISSPCPSPCSLVFKLLFRPCHATTTHRVNISQLIIITSPWCRHRPLLHPLLSCMLLLYLGSIFKDLCPICLCVSSASALLCFPSYWKATRQKTHMRKWVSSGTQRTENERRLVVSLLGALVNSCRSVGGAVGWVVVKEGRNDEGQSGAETVAS